MADAGMGAGQRAPDRVAHFYRDFPDGSIRTFMVKLDGTEVVFEARVYRTPEEASMGIYTSGWARASGAPVAGALEGCESDAVVRALAHLGYGDGGLLPESGPAAPALARDDDTLPLFAATG
jgi:hypothetical protein